MQEPLIYSVCILVWDKGTLHLFWGETLVYNYGCILYHLELNFSLLPPFLFPRSLAGAAMFITSVILSTVILVTKKGSSNVG